MDFRLLRWAVAAIAICHSGCGVMYLNAPPNSNIRLLGLDEKTEVKVERHAWFKYWGAEPMDPNDVNASKIIEEQGLKEARIQMTNTFVDGIYSIIPGILGFPRRTLVVEGNRTLHQLQGLRVETSNTQQNPTSTNAGVTKP